jgi:hypothetical protein
VKSPWKTQPTWARDSNGLLCVLVGKHLSYPTVDTARGLAAALNEYADTADAEFNALSELESA